MLDFSGVLSRSVRWLSAALSCLFCGMPAYAAPADVRADVVYQFDDNVPRSYKLSDQSISVNLGRSDVFFLSNHLRIVLNTSLGAEKFVRYDGLSRLSAGVHGELQYRSSSEFGTPVFGLSGKIAADQYQSNQRDGIRYALGATVRKTLTDRIRLFAAAVHNERRGRSVVFDNKDNAVRFNLDYVLNRSGTLYLGAEYRRGDIAITGPWWNVYGSAWEADDVFHKLALYNYRLNGRTVVSTLGYNHALGGLSALDFSWRRAQSSSQYLLLPYLSAVSLDYAANQYAVAYLVRF